MSSLKIASPSPELRKRLYYIVEGAGSDEELPLPKSLLKRMEKDSSKPSSPTSTYLERKSHTPSNRNSFGRDLAYGVGSSAYGEQSSAYGTAKRIPGGQNYQNFSQIENTQRYPGNQKPQSIRQAPSNPSLSEKRMRYREDEASRVLPAHLVSLKELGDRNREYRVHDDDTEFGLDEFRTSSRKAAMKEKHINQVIAKANGMGYDRPVRSYKAAPEYEAKPHANFNSNGNRHRSAFGHVSGNNNGPIDLEDTNSTYSGSTHYKMAKPPSFTFNPAEPPIYNQRLPQRIKMPSPDPPQNRNPLYFNQLFSKQANQYRNGLVGVEGGMREPTVSHETFSHLARSAPYQATEINRKPEVSYYYVNNKWVRKVTKPGERPNDDLRSINTSEEEELYHKPTRYNDENYPGDQANFIQEPVRNDGFFLKLTPSEEQMAIRSAVFHYDLIIEAVAGSGKTTAIMMMADAWEKANGGLIVILTYNKRLRFDTEDKVMKAGLKFIESHTLHSFCWKYYPGECSDDSTMNELISRDFPRKLKACDTPTLFIVDEAQDLSELYFRLIVKILKDFNPTARLVLLGDRFQMIYGYKGSDWRFFWMADQLLPAKYPRRWKRMPLSTSYRVHNRLAKFVNRCLLKQELIIPSRDVTGSFQPVYCYDNMFSESLWYKLRNMIEGYKDDDVFILGYTIKIKDSPIRKFVNWLSELGHGVHIAEDHEALSTIVMRDKIVFTTFHQSKGLERKLVIVFGFDAYFHEAKASNSGRGRSNYLNTCGDSSSCPNEIYVAVTRAKERCVLLHSEGNAPLPCLDTEQLKNCAEIWGDPESGFATSTIRRTLDSVFTTTIDESLEPAGKNTIQNRSQMSVKELVFHLPYHVIHKAKQLLAFHFPSNSTFSGLASTSTSSIFKPPDNFLKSLGPLQKVMGPPIDIVNHGSGQNTNTFMKSGSTGPNDPNYGITKQTGNRFESVNEINNLAIPLAIELKTRNTCSLLIERVILDAVYIYYHKGEYPDFETNMDKDLSFAELKKAGENIVHALERISRELDPTSLSIAQLLFIANEYIALKTGNQFKLKQITDYNWISEADISTAIKNLPEQISCKAHFHLTVWLKLDPKKMKNVSDTSSYSLNQTSNPVVLYSSIDILTDTSVILTKSSGSIRDDDVFQLVTIAFLLENGGNLTRAFYSENPRPQDHHSVALGLLQILKSAYKRTKNFHSFTDRSISHVLDEFQEIEALPKTGRKKYIVVNAFSGEKVEFEFRSIDQLNRAVEAILDYRLGVPEMPVNNVDFVQRVREIIDSN